MWRDGMSGFRYENQEIQLELIRANKSCAFCMLWCFRVVSILLLQWLPAQSCTNHLNNDVPPESGVKWITSEKLCHGKKSSNMLQGLIGLNVGCLFVFQPLPLTGRLRMVLASSFLASHVTGMGWFGTQKVVKVFWVAVVDGPTESA